MKTTNNRVHFNVKQIENFCDKGILKHSHTSWSRGYVSRKLKGLAYPYSGRFGRGYVILRPSRETTRFCRKEYYIYA